MKLYVAGKWYDKDNIKTYIEKLKSLNHEITHDWTVIETKNETGGTYEELGLYAEADIAGVLAADALVILITDAEYPYRGTSVELGVALGNNKPVYAVNLTNDNPAFLTMIFTKHKNITHLSSFEDLITNLG